MAWNGWRLWRTKTLINQSRPFKPSQPAVHGLQEMKSAYGSGFCTFYEDATTSENGGAEVSCTGCCYTHWRFTPVKVRAGTLSAGVSISELSLYNEDQRVDQSKISSFSTDGTELPGAEPARAFDSNAGSQWKNDELVPLVFSFDGAVAATKFTLTTSTLSSSEDPVRWQLHASEDKVRGFWRIKTVSTGWLLSFRIIVCWCKTFERWYFALSKFSNFQSYESDFKGNKVDWCMHVVFVLSCRILECFTRTGIAMSFGHNMTCGLMTSLPSKKHWKSWPRPPGLFSMSNLWILQFRKVAARRVKPFHWISAVKVVEANSITSPVLWD